MNLYKDGFVEGYSVHELVLWLFDRPRPTGLEGCHNDGNFRHNCIENLRWDTHKGDGSG